MNLVSGIHSVLLSNRGVSLDINTRKPILLSVRLTAPLCVQNDLKTENVIAHYIIAIRG